MKSKEGKPSFSANDFEITEREKLYQGFSSLEKLQIQHKCFKGGSQTVSRELLLRHDAVAVLLFDPVLDVVVLVEQFRVGAIADTNGPWMLELVAGLIDTDETPELVAKRECQEETGCLPKQLKLLSSFYLSPGISSEKLHLYLAEIDASEFIKNDSPADRIHGLPGEGEDIKVHVLSKQVAFTMLENGEISNAITQIGLQWLMIRSSALSNNF